MIYLVFSDLLYFPYQIKESNEKIKKFFFLIFKLNFLFINYINVYTCSIY